MENRLIQNGRSAVTKEQLTADEIRRRQYAVSMKDPDHLKRWLAETGKEWLVFNGKELVDSLPWPGGVETFVALIRCYEDHRRTIPSGRVEIQKEPITGEDIEVPLMKDQTLELFEIDRAIRSLIGMATEIDPSWSLDNAPL